MENGLVSKSEAFAKDIFVTGEYIHHFNPDDVLNPFFRIYQQKRRDLLDFVNGSDNLKTVLDVGGGMGRLSLALAKNPQNNVVLMDISVDMLTLAVNQAAKLDHLKVVKADAHRLPFRDRSFDYVVGLDLFCHLEEPEAALCEFRRVLADSGILILDSTNSNPLWALFFPRYLGKNPLNWFRIVKFKGVYPGWQSIVRHHSKKSFLALLQSVGFKVMRCLNYGPAICPKWHVAISKKVA